MKPETSLKIKEEVKKQFDTGFLAVARYPEWVANIVPVPKKDGNGSLSPPNKILWIHGYSVIYFFFFLIKDVVISLKVHFLLFFPAVA